MIKFEEVEVFGWRAAFRGMRNPKESWSKSDSSFGTNGEYVIGEMDEKLARQLCKAGTDHRKFLRFLIVQCDITAGHTWWAEFDTYKVGTVRNSCSKMHTIHVHPITKDMFDTEGITEVANSGDMHIMGQFEAYLATLESLRKRFNETHEKMYWRALIEMLPEGFHLKATVQLSYENLANIYKSRAGHKMFEWSSNEDGFMGFINSLPNNWLITQEE